MNDWGGYWLKYNKLDLRYNKYEKLLNKEAIFLGISPSDNNAVIIDFKNFDDLGKWIKISSHFPYGGKPAMQLENVSKYFTPINNALSKVMKIVNNT